MTILLLNQIVPADISSDFVETFGISDSAEGLNFTETLTASDLWSMYSVTFLDFSDSISTPTDSYSDYSLCNGVVDCNYSDFSFSSTAILSGVGQLNCISPMCTLDIEATNTVVGVLALSANCSFSGSGLIGQSGVLVVENNYSKVEMLAGINLNTIPVTGILSCENSDSDLQLSGIVDTLGNMEAVLFEFSVDIQATTSSIVVFNPTFGSYSFYANALEDNVATMQMAQDYNTLEMTGNTLTTAVMTMYNDRIVLEGNINAEYY